MHPRQNLHLWGRLAAIGTAAAIAACGGGSDDGAGGPSNGGPSTPPPATGLVAEFSSIQTHVFDAHCTECHAGDAAPAGLRLTAAHSYALLVGIASASEPQFLRVDPGNPDDSYLIMALEGTASAIPRMPNAAEGRAPLPQQDIDVVRQWIVEGAAPSDSMDEEEENGDPYEEPPAGVAGLASAAAGGAGAAATLTAGWPAPGAVLREGPQSIVLGASAELDASGLHAASVRLVHLDDLDPGTLQPRQIEGARLSTPVLAPTTVLLDTSAVEWRPGRYRLQVAGSGPYAVTDRHGRAIDGDGDGHPGGDFALEFTLDPAN